MINHSGITIRELKDLLKDWPTKNLDGSDARVWFRNRGKDRPILVTLAYGIGEKDLLLENKER